MLLKINKIYILCLFLVIVAFLSCSNNNNAVNPPQDGGSGENEVTISNPEFLRVGQIWREGSLYGYLTLGSVNEYRIGDTMAVRCRVKNPIWNDDGHRRRPIDPPIVAKVTSSETGDVQYITFAEDPFGWVEGGDTDKSEWVYTAYISPVKHERDEQPGGPKLLPDSTKQELNISSNGDVLTVEITHKDQILTKSITVKGKEIIINLHRFIKITGLEDPNNLKQTTPLPWSYADEYRIGDTMAIWCNITIRKSNGIWSTYDVRRDGPLPPIITKVTSSKTGDVQYITFVPFPFWVAIQIITGWHIAYISPVKSELNKMLPDPTREELNISPDGDILTVEIMYEDQFLTATINVKGD
jgi:uncharacterized protein YuzE